MRKKDYKHHFEGKNITVMGIGLLGRSLADILFLHDCGAHITATDKKDADDLKHSLSLLPSSSDRLKLSLGRHRINDFRKRDMILKSAGVPHDDKYINEAQSLDIPVHMSLNLLIDILRKEKVPVTFIGVTGTKGKSTVVSLIAAMLDKAKKPYHLSGNVRGTVALPLLKKIQPGDIILAEIDSWQLQGFHTISYSPHYAVFTNFFEDHMNYYEGSMKRYFHDKEAIFQYQTKNDTLVIGDTSVKTAIKKYQSKTPAKTVLASFEKDVPASWTYQISGRHNKQNIACAFHLGKALGLPHRAIKDALTTFEGVDGRFQTLGTDSQGRTFINDNNSTTPESTLLSLSSLKEDYPERNIVLIAGGSDKNFSYKNLARYMARHISRTVLFSGNGTDALLQAMPKKRGEVVKVLDMKTAVKMALAEAQSDDIIILSPAAASFGTFKNEYDRNDQFVDIITKHLKKKA